MNPAKYFKMSMGQIAESIRPKEHNFLTKDQLDELHKRTYDGTVEPKGQLITKCHIEVIEDEKEEEPPKHWVDRMIQDLDNINFE
jgi:hypothetical protein